MATLKYTPESYRNLLRMSRHKHLLVEGSSDKRFLRIVLDELRTIGKIDNTQKVDIDSAEDLIEFQVNIGNREKVEEMCARVNGLPFQNNLVGFVDREYREFELDHHISDPLSNHNIDGRLIWTRGHSIENYVFDLSVLRSPLRDLGLTTLFDDALNIFSVVFEEVIRIACAASLTGYKLEKTSMIKNSIEWNIFKIVPPHIYIEEQNWRTIIIRMDSTEEIGETILRTYQFWKTKISSVNFDVLRWLCHGHIGLKTIWEAYNKCVHDVASESRTNIRDALTVREDVRLNSCASSWSRISNREADFPHELFQMLGISTSAINQTKIAL